MKTTLALALVLVLPVSSAATQFHAADTESAALVSSPVPSQRFWPATSCVSNPLGDEAAWLVPILVEGEDSILRPVFLRSVETLGGFVDAEIRVGDLATIQAIDVVLNGTDRDRPVGPAATARTDAPFPTSLPRTVRLPLEPGEAGPVDGLVLEVNVRGIGVCGGATSPTLRAEVNLDLRHAFYVESLSIRPVGSLWTAEASLLYAFGPKLILRVDFELLAPDGSRTSHAAGFTIEGGAFTASTPLVVPGGWQSGVYNLTLRANLAGSDSQSFNAFFQPDDGIGLVCLDLYCRPIATSPGSKQSPALGTGIVVAMIGLALLRRKR